MADKTEKKPGFVARMKGFGANIAKFFRDTKSELKKVVWPTGDQLWRYFVVVLVFVLFIMFFVAGLDALFGWLLLKVLG